uniref:Uncharacterized protein n=1 Tax=Glossina pallidipes TaxID=7398 RepID=A0A1A9ZAS3_GLOPL
MYIEVSLKNIDRNNKGNQQFRIIKCCIHHIWINVRIKRNLAANDAVEKLLSLDEMSAVQHVCSWLAIECGFDGFAFCANLLNENHLKFLISTSAHTHSFLISRIFALDS